MSRVIGADRVLQNLRKFGADFEAEVSKAVTTTAHQVRTNAVRKIQRDAATGRVYVLSSPNRTHQASAPGQPPATDTGALASSITAIIDGPHRARVGTALDYGFYLEHGTANIEPRPWLHPSLLEARPDHARRLNRVFQSAARRIQP